MDSKFSNAGDIDANSRVHSVVLSGFGDSAENDLPGVR